MCNQCKNAILKTQSYKLSQLHKGQSIFTSISTSPFKLDYMRLFSNGCVIFLHLNPEDISLCYYFFETFNWVLKITWSYFVNYIKIAKCFWFGHRRVDRTELWKTLLLGRLDQSKPSAAPSFFPSTLSLPHTNQLHATYFPFSFPICCIALASTIRFFRLLKKHLLINSLATAASPSARCKLVFVARMWCLAAYYSGQSS